MNVLDRESRVRREDGVNITTSKGWDGWAGRATLQKCACTGCEIGQPFSAQGIRVVIVAHVPRAEPSSILMGWADGGKADGGGHVPDLDCWMFGQSPLLDRFDHLSYLPMALRLVSKAALHWLHAEAIGMALSEHLRKEVKGTAGPK